MNHGLLKHGEEGAVSRNFRPECCVEPGLASRFVFDFVLNKCLRGDSVKPFEVSREMALVTEAGLGGNAG